MMARHDHSAYVLRSLRELLTLDVCRTSVSDGLVPLFHREDPFLPTLLSTQSIKSILPPYEVNDLRFLAGESQGLKLLGKGLNTLEASNEVEEDKSLRVHVLPQINVFTKIVDGEVVLDLHCDHCN